MGIPVSAVIANLCMEIFEEQAIESAPYKPKKWKRYVDDTFTILDRNKVDLLTTPQQSTTIHPFHHGDQEKEQDRFCQHISL